MQDKTQEQGTVSTRLALALKRLRARLREETQANTAGLSLAELAILQRLRCKGPLTAASLAAIEHVSQQAIAQSVARLKAAGYVQTTPDPTDRRKILIHVTDTARRLHESIIASRNAWLDRAIDASFDADEQAALSTLIELLERLADADC